MATSSIFTDFSIRDKKKAHAFVKALEASEKAPSQQGTAHFSIVESHSIYIRDFDAILP